MTRLTYKGYGRIYTNPENIQDVVNIIREMDQFEFDYYYPESFVGCWDDYPVVVYNGKFELDCDELESICKEKSIPIFIFNAEFDYQPRGYYKLISKSELKQLFHQIQNEKP
jgi:hypothetical protein